ncbi:(R)-mandelonitrile lyase [Peristeroidobacter soli]|uniref:(R)-mandelonitrile lyase n=1 Tax=Peristeroidobacter soli TaxID=2497877 RepID=UPI00101CADB5|nr:cupin domain-containing protein [Peristeroidobacter soli]
MKPVGPSLVILSSILATSVEAAENSGGSDQGALTILRATDAAAVQGGARNFTGDVTVRSQFQRDAPARVGGATVTFQPGARTAWHSHPLGQTLIVTAGTGWVQREGASKQTIRLGDVVWIPPGVKHWHGATTGSAMTHIAIAESQAGNVVTWMEQVTDTQYRQ